MQVSCQIDNPGIIGVRITTVMTLSGWRSICDALSEGSSAPSSILLGEIRSALNDFEHVAVRSVDKDGSKG